MSELKPCPFCGGAGSLKTMVSTKSIFAICLACGAIGPFIRYKHRATDEDIAKAIEAWNRRRTN